jgi:hypothetical protein
MAAFQVKVNSSHTATPIRQRAVMGPWIVLVAGLEAAATGLFVVAAPSLFAWVILGSDLSRPGQALVRLFGIVLFSLGFAGWTAAKHADGSRWMLRPMQIYNLLATIYLVYLGLGLSGESTGILLWPAVGIHAILSILLTHASFLSDR